MFYSKAFWESIEWYEIKYNTVLVLKQREGLEAEEPSKKAGELSELDQEQRSRGFYIET